jgi:hypothetical protein
MVKVALEKNLIPGNRIKFYFKSDLDKTEYWGVVTITPLGSLDIEPEINYIDGFEYIEPAIENYGITNYEHQI